jgi:hypothetical protein
MNIVNGTDFQRKFSFFLKRFLRRVRRNEPLHVFGSTRTDGSDRIEAVYIINLDRQPARWRNFVGEARRQVVEGGRSLMDFCRRVSAIDGKLEVPSDVASDVAATYPLESQYYVDPDPRLLPKIREEAVKINMTREEVAVALSHVKAWRRLIADGVPYALVLEDDVFFEGTFAARLNQTWQELSESRADGARFDLLYLSYRQVDRGAERVLLSSNLVRPIRGYWEPRDCCNCCRS